MNEDADLRGLLNRLFTVAISRQAIDRKIENTKKSADINENSLSRDIYFSNIGQPLCDDYVDCGLVCWECVSIWAYTKNMFISRDHTSTLFRGLPLSANELLENLCVTLKHLINSIP